MDTFQKNKSLQCWQTWFRSTILHLFFLSLLICQVPIATQAAHLQAVLVYEGPNNDFYDILFNIAGELKTLGIIDNAPKINTIPDGDTQSLWNWLSFESKGTQLSFHADGFYSAEWDPNKRETVKEAVRSRLEKRKDVDLILAFGTWAGYEMSRLNTSVPVIVTGVTDAVNANILGASKNSKKDNVVAVVESGRILQQIELFHHIFGFHKLGITYTDTPSARSCAAIEQIETACEQNDVQLVRCVGDFFHTTDTNKIAEQMKICHKKLLEQDVDAVFITYNSLPAKQLPQVLEPLIKAKIPVISQSGTREVKMGVLASTTSYSKKEGKFVAKIIQELLKNAKPSSLPNKLHTTMRLCINVSTAARIGWNPSLQVLLSIDEFFQ